jgi:hypothetical protein
MGQYKPNLTGLIIWMLPLVFGVVLYPCFSNQFSFGDVRQADHMELSDDTIKGVSHYMSKSIGQRSRSLAYLYQSWRSYGNG